MAKAFRELIGVGPSTASTKDSVLVIIDAQNEYVVSSSIYPAIVLIYSIQLTTITDTQTDTSRPKM